MPDWTTDIRARLAGSRLSPADEANVAEELQQHLDDRYHELRGNGVAEAEARRAALEELGENEFLRQHLRGAMRRAADPVPLGAREGRGLAGIWGDLRFGARMLRRSPGFTITAALTIALGIGANTTIFSIVNALLLRPLVGAVRPSELVMIGRTQEGQGFDTFSYPDYVDFRNGARSLSAIAASFVAPAHLSTGGASERVRVELVSGSYFPMLGTRAAQGRLFIPADDGAPGANPIAVLSNGVWQRRFGSDPAVIGKSIRINGSLFTVVGVAEPGFNGVRSAGVVDLFVPIAMIRRFGEFDGMLERRSGVWIDLFGRLAPNATIATAQAELGTIASELARRYRDSNRGRGVRVAGGVGFDPESRRQVRMFMSILVGVVALVLLIACANVANLLLARGSARARELAVRASLGASRTRLVRQLVAEGFLLAILGGTAGFVLGVWSLKFVLQLPVFVNTFGAVTPSVDLRVLAFGIVAMLMSGALFALPPAFRTSRVDLGSALKLGSPGSGDNRSRLRNGLVVAQLALSLVLLVAAGLFVRTLQALYRIEPGFETKHVLIATLDAGLQGYDETRGRRLFTEIEDRVRAIPGVEAASMAYMIPLGGGGWDTRIFAGEAAPPEGAPGLKSDINAVSATYFQTLGMRILKGRDFTSADREGSPAVAVINEAIAEQLWPGMDPVGQRFRIGRSNDVLEVVGVVRTARYRSLVEAPRPFYYRPFAALAAIGLYGSMAYAVSRRTREMGVRMALGARPSEVLRYVLTQALRVALGGTAIGLAAAIPATRYLRSLLYGVDPIDPATLFSVVMVLAAASIAAAYVPARRATRVDPVVALRSD